MRRISLNRDELWITNLVKCYSLNDREPTQEEISNCLAYVLAEIKILKPWLVVTFGKQSSYAILGFRKQWDQVRAKLHIGRLENQIFLVLPVTHPGQAVRGNRGLIYSDFNKLKLVIENKEKLVEKCKNFLKIEHPGKGIV